MRPGAPIFGCSAHWAVMPKSRLRSPASVSSSIKCNYGCWTLSHASVRQHLPRQLTPAKQARWEVSDFILATFRFFAFSHKLDPKRTLVSRTAIVVSPCSFALRVVMQYPNRLGAVTSGRVSNATARLHQGVSWFGPKGRNYLFPGGVVCVPSCPSCRAQTRNVASFFWAGFQALERICQRHPRGIETAISWTLHIIENSMVTALQRRGPRGSVSRVSQCPVCQPPF